MKLCGIMFGVAEVYATVQHSYSSASGTPGTLRGRNLERLHPLQRKLPRYWRTHLWNCLVESERLISLFPRIGTEDPSGNCALYDEVLKQKEFPTNTTAAFMAKACDAVDQLPPDWFPRERTETLTLISRFYYLDGQTQPAIESAAKAVEAAVLGKHEDLEIVARARHGVALRTAYDFSGATRELVHGIEIARQRGVADWEAKLLSQSRKYLQRRRLAV